MWNNITRLLHKSFIMPLHLTQNQIDQFHHSGYVAPIDVMPEETALAYADQLMQAEKKYPGALQGKNRNNAHLVFKFLDEIAFNETILDIVQDLIGPDLLLWGCVLFIKEPESKGYVSWHQDATYMGLEPQSFVTPWLALSPSNEESGCMSVIPGSHLERIQNHEDQAEADNLLTRGQRITNVDESKATNLILRPGQCSCHHAKIIHGSRPNRSNHHRIGVALQAFITPDTRQTAPHSHAILARGEDKFGHHTLMPRPEKDMAEDSIVLRDEVNENWAKILYRGSGHSQKY